METRRLELAPILDVSLYEGEAGQLIVVAERGQPNFGGAELNPAQDSVFVVLESDGVPPDTTVRLPGKEAVTWVAYADGRPQATAQLPLPFGRATLVGALANSVAVAGSGDGALAFLGLDGSVLHSAFRSDLSPQPVHDRILVEREGQQVWLRDFVAPGAEGEPQRWTVHDDRGRIVARLTTPARLEVMQIAGDRMAGVVRDEMGVEYVTIHRIRGSSVGA